VLDKFLKVFSYFVLVPLVFIFVYSGMNYIEIHNSIKEENWGLIQSKRHLQQKLSECQEYNPFQRTLKEIGGRTYRKEYNCLDHTVDLYDELEKEGIKSVILISENREHAWIGVYIESTEGNFIDPSKELKIIEIRDGNLNVICNCQ